MSTPAYSASSMRAASPPAPGRQVLVADLHQRPRLVDLTRCRSGNSSKSLRRGELDEIRRDQFDGARRLQASHRSRLPRQPRAAAAERRISPGPRAVLSEDGGVGVARLPDHDLVEAKRLPGHDLRELLRSVLAIPSPAGCRWGCARHSRDIRQASDGHERAQRNAGGEIDGTYGAVASTKTKS